MSLNISLEKKFNSGNKKNCAKTGEEEIKVFVEPSRAWNA